MKKHSAFLMLLASVSFLLGSCAKEVGPTGEDEKVIPLSVPANLQSLTDSLGMITLSWSAVDKADGYVWEIYDWNSDLRVTSKTRNLSVTVEKLYLGGRYSARVKAVAGTKSNSDFSESVQFFPGGAEIVYFTGKAASSAFKWSATDSVLVSDGVNQAVYVPALTGVGTTDLRPAEGEPALNPEAATYTAKYPKESEDILTRPDTIKYTGDIPNVGTSASSTTRELVFKPSGGILHIAAANTESIRLLSLKIGTSRKICAGDTLTVDCSESEVFLGQDTLDLYLAMPVGDYSDLKLLFHTYKGKPEPGVTAQPTVITEGDTTHISAALGIESKALNLKLSFENNILTASTYVGRTPVTDATVYYERSYDSAEAVATPSTSSKILPAEGLDLGGAHIYVKVFAANAEDRTAVIEQDCNGMSGIGLGTCWTYDTTAVGFGQSFKRYIDAFGKANFINSAKFTADNLTVWNSSTEEFSAAFQYGSLRVQANSKVKHKFTVGSTGAARLRLNISSKDPGYTKNRSLSVSLNGESYYYNKEGVPDVGKGNDPTSGWVIIDFPADKINPGDEIMINTGYCRLYGIYWEALTE